MTLVCYLRGTVKAFTAFSVKKVLQLCMLTLVCIITICDCEEVTQLEGYFGGEVQFRCPADKKMQMLYLQKKDVFVNGYYDSEDMNKHNPWTNSRVDRQHNIIYMSGLNISHSGVYTCHYEYEGGSFVEEKAIKLTVTANYSDPSVYVMNCTEKQEQCLVHCSSYGGYPKRDLSWNITGAEKSTDAEAWRIISRNVQTNNDTELFNISSTAAFNCSTGKVQNISCSMHGVTTELSICHEEIFPQKEPSHLIIVIVVFVCVGLILGIICCIKEKIIRVHEEDGYQSQQYTVAEEKM